MDLVLEFLGNRTPSPWAERAVDELETLLLDHATLELKAAHQAQRLIWKYGSDRDDIFPDTRIRMDLVQRMSRLAREELRHFEQVLAILQAREIRYEPLQPCGYARALHEQIRGAEPGRLIDTLIVGALIEARSCERFYSIVPLLAKKDPELARFYRSLLRSEARHFGDYLRLAEITARGDIAHRVAALRSFEASLMFVPAPHLRFHSGVDPAGSKSGAVSGAAK